MGITIGGLSSGLPPNLVEQILDAERMPIKNLEKKKEKIDIKLKLVDELQTKLRAIEGTLGTLASVKGFNDIKLESGDGNIIAGTADLSAPVGSWNVEVVQLAQKASAITNGFPDKDKTEIGVGYFKFDTPEGTKEVYISGENSTLQGAANAINQAGIGIKATVINDKKDADEPYKLMISGESVGGDNTIKYPTLYFLDGDQDIYFDQDTEARNGIIKVDGFEFEISSNTVNDIIPGVVLDIRQAAPGRSVNLTIKENREAVSGKVNEFVKAVNEVLSFIQQQNAMTEKTDTSKTLGGDALIRGVENRMRKLIQDPQFGIQGEIKRLSQLGVEFTRSGTVKLNEEKFNSVLSSKPDDVRKFFAGDGFNVGFIPSIKREIAILTNSAFGSLGQKKKGLEDNLTRIDQSIANKERLMQRREDNLRRKFAKLEETMAGLKTQGAALGGIATQSSFAGAILQQGQS
jgi:flagellar hook-associated protein 2